MNHRLYERSFGNFDPRSGAEPEVGGWKRWFRCVVEHAYPASPVSPKSKVKVEYIVLFNEEGLARFKAEAPVELQARAQVFSQRPDELKNSVHMVFGPGRDPVRGRLPETAEAWDAIENPIEEVPDVEAILRDADRIAGIG